MKNITGNRTQALFLKFRIFPLMFSSGEVLTIDVPASTCLGWVAGAKSLQQRQRQGEICASAHAFLGFLFGNYNSEWVILKWLNETGPKF